MFLILFRNILCSQQMFPSLCSSRNIMDNNVSSFTRAFRSKKPLKCPLIAGFVQENDLIFNRGCPLNMESAYALVN